MGSSVRVKEASVVTPCEPTPSSVLALSALDSQLFLRFTIEYLFVYEPRSSVDRAATTACLKQALARALVPYYPFAGRVRPTPDGPGLEVVCAAQGAVFIEASAERYTANDFEKAPKTVTHWRALLSLHVADVLKGSPPLVVQLTWLGGGGAALGVGINHCLCDGIGSAEFLNYLAELANGKSEWWSKVPKPVWERHLLNPTRGKQTRVDPASHPEFERVPDLCGGFMKKVSTGLRPTSVTFDKRRLSELKRLAGCTSEPGESVRFTSFEVLAAHVWRSWARALKFPGNQVLKLVFSVNVRKHVRPCLGEGYYGNAFVLGCAETSAKELEERGIGYGSGLVKRAKERVGNEHVRGVIEWVWERKACPDPVGVLILSQWSRLGLENVDVGLGKPVHVGPVCCDRYCLFLPVRDECVSVKVMVAVPTSAVDNYELFMRASHL
ncbi:omega-hydroxypalmitate O-feruloyl transferase [Cajanus cajan]|uniref:Taxadien-5-alpha-ol O-acetyltransferase n=1 Tax=Cajanus cajan TaxID=3821 RepID=A0A151U184_CAJCA|nr:omega-hydroxypalmitate O-feruloyl transferase [Cajanus cajan]KYP73076.1 Taxadien-5-alpha-ol O-acetyltransferase [Cajanus cajan]